MSRRLLCAVLCAVVLPSCGGDSESADRPDELSSPSVTDSPGVDVGSASAEPPRLECGSELVSSGVAERAPESLARGLPREEALRELLRTSDVLAPLSEDVPSDLGTSESTSAFRLLGNEGSSGVQYVTLQDRELVVGVFELTQSADGGWVGTSLGFCFETGRRLAEEAR
jgi:hypothetical protein